MRRCWDISSSKRPQFSELVNLLGQILDDNVKQVLHPSVISNKFEA